MVDCKSLSIAVAVALLLGRSRRWRCQQPSAQPKPPGPSAIAIDDKSIGGVVTSRFGPEAGVWVIAETKDLGTRFAKIVVTDERGRYVIPDLPKANYRLWVRGYGLVDSQKVPAEVGKTLNLTAVVAPSLAAAAQYYPAIYWASMIKVPDKSRFPGTGDNGNGIPENFKTQEQWLNFVKTNGCGNCHQIGNYATRTIPGAFGHFVGARRLVPSAFGRARRARHAEFHHAGDDVRRRAFGGTRRLDRPYQGGRVAEAAARRGRSALSGIPSSRCAIGSTRSITCTI